jgi:hypothetical protein
LIGIQAASITKNLKHKKETPMNKFRFTLTAIAIVAFTLMISSYAQAQAVRTWVSGVGDDLNPCSRTAPCKTFPGAISKTAANGEIDCLDEGGFGAISITKSITIDGTYGSGFGSILASGTNGVSINVPSGSVTDPLRTVRLRNLSIQGAGLSGSVGTRTGLRGIKVFSALQVYIENCLVTDFSDRGISDERSGSGTLYITNTIVRNTGGSNIVVLPAGSTTITAVLDNVHAEGSATNSGIVFDSSAAGAAVKATVRESYATGNSASGLFVAGGADVMVEGCVFSHNVTGMTANTPAVIKLTNTTITHNTGNSLVGPAQVSSTGKNTIVGNGGGNVLPSGAPITQS